MFVTIEYHVIAEWFYCGHCLWGMMQL